LATRKQPEEKPMSASIDTDAYWRCADPFTREVMSDLTVQEREALDRIPDKVAYRLQTMP